MVVNILGSPMRPIANVPSLTIQNACRSRAVPSTSAAPFPHLKDFTVKKAARAAVFTPIGDPCILTMAQGLSCRSGKAGLTIISVVRKGMAISPVGQSPASSHAMTVHHTAQRQLRGESDQT